MAEEDNTSSWKSLKKMIKNSVQEVKKKIKEYTQEGEPGQTKTNLYGQKRKIITEPAPPKEFNCPFCHSPVSDELISVLKENKSIICERCGANLQLSDF